MQIDAENYGAIIILNASGSITQADVQALIGELAAKCSSTIHIVLNLTRAEISAQIAGPLFTLRDQQRYLKPKVWIVSPHLEMADSPYLTEVLPALEMNEALQLHKIYTGRISKMNLQAKNEEVEVRVRDTLSLPEGFKQEEYEAAHRAAREKNYTAKRLAASTSAHVEMLRKAVVPVAEDEDDVKRLAKFNAKAYAAVRGE